MPAQSAAKKTSSHAAACGSSSGSSPGIFRESRGLHRPASPVSLPGMESHEWKEQTEEGKRYYRANFRGGRWTLLTTTMKRDPVWDIVPVLTLDHWRELRTLVWNKYQRKRCPYERVEGIDREIEKAENAR
ncbi:MAG: hypothetical protein ACNA8L_09165 [Luteolibacter sp.]